MPTSVENESEKNIPTKYSLEQNYPNPFNPTTIINYSVPFAISNPNEASGVKSQGISHAPSRGRNDVANVSLKVYDILGREVATLVNKKQAPGNYSVKFDVSNLSSGIYFYRLTAGDFVVTKKMILMK